MSFLLAEAPGFTDLNDSLLTANSAYATGFLLSAVKDDIAAGTVMPEFFQGFYTHGQTVPLPISPVDGYQYQQNELAYAWEVMNTVSMGSGLPSANGGLLWGQWFCDQSSGLVTCIEAYYVPGGAQTNTNDGVLKVTTIGVRGKQLRKMTATITGTVTSGAFQLGERLVQSVTGATAYVDNGSALPATTTIPLTVLQAVMGAPDATHTWVGSSSGAIFTPNALPSPFPLKYFIAGTLTSGTFANGEVVKQGTSLATGIATPPLNLAAGPLFLLGPLTGTPDASHTWVGQTSGAIFTPSAAPIFNSSRYTDLPASAWALDTPLTQTQTRDLMNNARLSTVRTEAFLMNPSAAPTWLPYHSYTAGDLVQPSGRWANGCWYVCAVDGTSGGIEPGPWPSNLTETQPIPDGGTAWNITGMGFTFGQQVPLPVSPIDGYEYSQAEIYVVMPFFVTTLALPVQKGVNIVWTSGRGDLRALSKNIVSTQPNDPSTLPAGTQAPDNTGATIYTQWNFGSTPPAEVHEPALLSPGSPTTGCGIVYNAVWYGDGVYADGALNVLVIASRALGRPMAAPGGAVYADFATDNMLSGLPLPTAEMQSLNENAKFSILRPEATMELSVTPGGIVPIAPSAWDAYAYSPSECQYLEWWTNTGAAPGDLRDFSVQVNPSTGVVQTRTDYYRGGGWNTTISILSPLLSWLVGDGTSVSTVMRGYPGSPVDVNLPGGGPWGVPTVNVAVIASRQYENEQQNVQLVATPTNTSPAPAGNGNLLLNAGFDFWSLPNTTAIALAGVADDWYVEEKIGTTAFLQEAGLLPGSNFAQGIGAKYTGSTLSLRSTNAENRASIQSVRIPINPNGVYSFAFVAQASSEVINYGFYCRIHLLDSNLGNDTGFDLLWPGQIPATIPGAITSGTFLVGEEVIQGTTGAVTFCAANTAPLQVFGGVVGVPDASHVWVGQVSSANFTPSDVPSLGATADESAPPGTGLSSNPGSPLNTSLQVFGNPAYVFQIPPNGALSASTSFGASRLHQSSTPVTLGFVPAYMYIEFDLWSPMNNGGGPGGAGMMFAIVDNCVLNNVTGTLAPTTSGGGLIAGPSANPGRRGRPISALYGNTGTGDGIYPVLGVGDGQAISLDTQVADGPTFKRITAATSGNQATTASIQSGAVSATVSASLGSPLNLTFNVWVTLVSVTLTPSNGVVFLTASGVLDSVYGNPLPSQVLLQIYKGASPIGAQQSVLLPGAPGGQGPPFGLQTIDTSPGSSPETYTLQAYWNTNTYAYPDYAEAGCTLSTINLKV